MATVANHGGAGGWAAELARAWPAHAPRPKRWSKAEFNDYVERGAFAGQPFYLFRGELIEMPAMGYAHANAVTRLSKAVFAAIDGQRFDVRVQMPFDVPGDSMPEPDLLVCTVEAAARRPHPASAILVVEVADSSLAYDRDKASEYAAAGVGEYWIVDLQGRCVEVYRGAVEDRTAPLGFRYPPPRVFGEAETLAVPSLNLVGIVVGALMPQG